MDIMNNLFNMIFESVKLIFSHDTSNPFYVVSVFTVLSIIVIMVLMALLGKKYND